MVYSFHVFNVGVFVCCCICSKTARIVYFRELKPDNKIFTWKGSWECGLSGSLCFGYQYVLWLGSTDLSFITNAFGCWNRLAVSSHPYNIFSIFLLVGNWLCMAAFVFRLVRGREREVLKVDFNETVKGLQRGVFIPGCCELWPRRQPFRSSAAGRW